MRHNDSLLCGYINFCIGFIMQNSTSGLFCAVNTAGVLRVSLLHDCFPLTAVMDMSISLSDVNMNGGKWCLNQPVLRTLPKYAVYLSCIIFALRIKT